MKKNRIFMMAFAAMLSVGVVSCSMKSNDNGSGNGGNSGGGNTTVEWIDLGLPSGLLWNSCNLGATSPEEYGNYYAWGETTMKEVYDWSTYAYGNDNYALTKYCNDARKGLNGFTDNLTILEAMDDAATAALGNDARTPTKEEWEELINNTTVEWTTQNGTKGRKFTSTANGNTLFLPAAGGRNGSRLENAGSYGYFWSSSLDTDNSSSAWFFIFDSGQQVMRFDSRDAGFSVRAVRQN